jgi:hypothetical protein
MVGRGGQTSHFTDFVSTAGEDRALQGIRKETYKNKINTHGIQYMHKLSFVTDISSLMFIKNVYNNDTIKKYCAM